MKLAEARSFFVPLLLEKRPNHNLVDERRVVMTRYIIAAAGVLSLTGASRSQPFTSVQFPSGSAAGTVLATTTGTQTVYLDPGSATKFFVRVQLATSP